MKLFKILIIVSMCPGLLPTNAQALGVVSRACNFSTIPGPLKSPALLFFRLLGMPEEYQDLASRPIEEQENHWILESLTTDYGELRYYLFAASRSYNWRISSGQDRSLIRNHEQSSTSQWAAESIDPRILADSRLQIFKFNRNVLFSARAGYPTIIQKKFGVYLEPQINKIDTYLTIGRHWYYDPEANESYELQNTYAYNCNLEKWGLEDR